MKRLKQAKLMAQALNPVNIAKGIEAARHPPTQEQIDAALARLTPEQRAAYDQQIESGREATQAAYEQAKEREETTRVLRGPAGLAVHGPGMEQYGTPQEIEQRMREQGVWRVSRDMGKGQGSSPKPLEIVDSAQRAQHAAHERAVRDAARAPYRSPHAAPVAISRLPTRGKSQLEEVLAHLNGSGLAPDRIFGVYRVPDRISQTLTPHSEKGRLVEWDIVYAPGAGHATPLTMTVFPADQQWVAKRVGEPSVLDEDLALAFCAGAGIGPEHCAGLARIGDFRALQGGDEHTSTPVRTMVRGIAVVHAPETTRAFERMSAGAPLHLGPPSGIHIELLNWDAVRAAVHPKINHAPPVPSPFPYLPATPQELLRAYLEVVGVQPADSYSAQATVHRAQSLIESGVMSKNFGPKQPCADGKDRMRAHGCQHVVFVYRDRPEYVEGRARWAAYQAEVLQARLELGVRVRGPVADPDEYSDLPRFLRPIARTAVFVDRLHPDNWFDGVEELPPQRYCWPPVR